MYIISLLVVLNVLGMVFFYSPISLYGYWTDFIVLMVISIVTLMLIKRTKPPILKIALLVTATGNIFVILIMTFSFWDGIVPVHKIPPSHVYQDDVRFENYSYFVERGNFGLLSKCFGEIHYCKRLKAIPFIEYRYEVQPCSVLDYEYIMYGH